MDEVSLLKVLINYSPMLTLSVVIALVVVEV